MKPEATDVRGYGQDVEKSKALTMLAERREELQRELPTDADDLLPWLLKQPEAGVLKVTSFPPSSTVEIVAVSDVPDVQPWLYVQLYCALCEISPVS